MTTDKRYNLINNLGGWFVFFIALATYWITLEPTASYWDCGEFIIQADKLEVGHPPGNPIFMLTARFFANFAYDAQHVALMVNAMSGLLSALTILLLFWTITHLVKRLVVRDGKESPISWQQYLAIMGSGLVGALAYCWSDTFWFSAVEGEVYAFSSFCTALVFWLILKWEDHADSPSSDRYLILIAYVIGVSIAVHLLNLLCITAIVLVFVYRKYKDMNVAKSLFAILVSFAIIALVLYGLVPGFIKVAQRFELFFVNGMGWGYNSGALAYAVFMLLLFGWTLYELQAQRNGTFVRLSCFLTVLFSGMLFFGSGIWIGLGLTVLLGFVLWGWFQRGLPVRVLNVVMWSIAVIFVGYSSYALILIRSTADTPMNQNSPDNVFDLASYLNREQYGAYPLIYGETMNSKPQRVYNGTEDRWIGDARVRTPAYSSDEKVGKALYVKGVKGMTPTSSRLSPEEKENNASLAAKRDQYYVVKDHDANTIYNPELNMWFPRLYSNMHISAYEEWINPNDYEIVGLSAIDAENGGKLPEYDLNGDYDVREDADGNKYYVPVTVAKAKKPSFSQNLAYFFNYQLNHMYMRYFMWNFAGRQNDLLNQHGEYDLGNWISGYGFIDNPRLGDQSLLPDDLGKDNAGHNVYYMFPLFLGLIGLLWQAFAGRRGIEQFWVVFFLFFMTGIAIVFYLNQPPNQPRERDYAFAGSFYAFAIWIGLGVAGLWRILLYFAATRKWLAGRKTAGASAEEEEPLQVESIVDEPKAFGQKSLVCACIACGLGLVVPLQMVSQTWDDHDRSGRYAARDFAVNYLESLEPNAIIFCNGDNDTFPLWYAQEVEGVRPDVRIVNISYLNSDWYANQQRMQAYEAEPVPMTALPEQYAYDHLNYAYIVPDSVSRPLLEVLKNAYAADEPLLTSPAYIPVDKKVAMERGLIDANDTTTFTGRMEFDLEAIGQQKGVPVLTLNEMLVLDIVATNAAQGWKRPIYIANSVGTEFHAGLTPYLKQVGLALQVVPTYQSSTIVRTDKAYNVIMNKFKWGGADNKERSPYFDETAGRMYYSVRSTILDTAQQLVAEGDIMGSDTPEAKENYKKALQLLQLMQANMLEGVQKYQIYPALILGSTLYDLGQKERLDNPKLVAEGRETLKKLLLRAIPYQRYNRMIEANFGVNASRYYHTLLYSYQFLSLYEEYEKMGGDVAPINSALKAAGLSIEKLREEARMREEARSRQLSSMDDEVEVTEEADDFKKMMMYLLTAQEAVSQLQGLSPDAYAARSEEEKDLDSVYYGLIDYMYAAQMGEVFTQYPELLQVDTARSHRLWNQYSKK